MLTQICVTTWRHWATIIMADFGRVFYIVDIKKSPCKWGDVRTRSKCLSRSALSKKLVLIQKRDTGLISEIEYSLDNVPKDRRYQTILCWGCCSTIITIGWMTFDLLMNKYCKLEHIRRLSKQSWGWLLETLSHPLWRHCSAMTL